MQGAPPPGNPWLAPAQPNDIQLVPGTITEREPVLVLVLMLITCNIYSTWWIYKTTAELKEATRDESLNPGMDLLLTIVTCSLWALWVEYRNAKKVHAALLAREPGRRDRSETVLLLNVVALAVYVTGFVSSYLVQEEYNALARATRLPAFQWPRVTTR